MSSAYSERKFANTDSENKNSRLTDVTHSFRRGKG